MPPTPSLRIRLFGPSRADRLMDILEADRASVAAQHQQTLLLMAQMVESVNAQTAITQQQLDALKVPHGDPIVRLMTDDIEARYERERSRARVTSDPSTVTTLSTDTLLADLAADIDRHAFA